MGVVYRAEDTRLGRSVALKFLSPELFTDQQARERFQREARAASALNHPNICTIYDIGEQGGQPFLVMELLEGQTLKALLRGQPLPLDQVLDLGLQIANALDAAHSRGIVHRDVKPANILVTQRGQVKVLDFGLARPAGRPVAWAADASPTAAVQDVYLTSPGTAVGTPAYMAPEQVRGDFADQRSDIYSFGTLLYEMATGRHPFAEEVRAGSTARVFAAILHRDAQSSRLLNPNVLPKIEAIILKCLEKRPEKRFQSIKEIADALSVMKREQPKHFLHEHAPAAVRHTGTLAAIAYSVGFFHRLSSMESGERFAWFTLVAMGAFIMVGLTLFRGTVLGFGMTFGAAVLAYEGYLLLRTYKE